MKPVRSAARALLGAIFVVGGARTLARPDSQVEPARRVTDPLTPWLERADPRLPTDPRTLVRLHAAVGVVGGLLLARGRLARPAAAVLAASLVPTTIAGHPFWAADATNRRQQEIHFMKNLGLLGGLLLAAADTGGRPGLRYRTGHLVDRSRRSVRRVARTARREAKIATASALLARRLPG